MKLISAFLASLESGKAGKAVRAALPAIDQHYEHFLRYEAEFGGMIYGTNTLPGHRDGDLLDHVDHGAYQLELIRKHCIGGAPYFGPDVARAVTLAKVYSCLEPGVTLSGALVGAALDAFEAEDFQPQIPHNSSYSSGDVIPAAHWSAALLDWQAKRSSYVLRPGEGMALINGAFAHVGATAALCSRIKTFWPLLLEAQRISLTVMGADRRAFRVMGAPEASWGAASNAYVSADLEDHTSARQDPVSTRSVVQCLGALTAAIDVLFSACDASLSKPSGNPLFFEEPVRGHAPNGSFLDPALTIFTGAVIEALLMTGWASVQRINHMLSGKNEPIPMDAATPADPMGLIQWPKNAQAKLEKMRRACGTRAFVSGGSTSYGVEDMWSFGLQTAQLAMDALDELRAIISLELFTALFAAKAGGLKSPFDGPPLSQLDTAFCTEKDAEDVAARVVETAAAKRDIPFLL